MKTLVRSLLYSGIVTGLAGLAPAATMTMNGMISDSMCGASHAKMTAAHPNLNDRACTLACVKGGAKYVFVSNGKVYQVANQSLADLQKDAGDAVTVTGDVNGDTITVSKVMMEKKKK